MGVKLNSPLRYYRKRYTEVKAMQWTGENTADVVNFVDTLLIDSETGKLRVRTPVGDVELHKNDYIVKNIQGEFGVYKPEIFEYKFELIEF